MRTAFESEGDVRGVDILAALVSLWREGASGSLQFSRPGATAGFEIVAGELAATSSSDSRFETAAILVRAGKLDARTLERLAAPEGADRALLALQAGVLTRREWRWGEKIRAVEILSDLLSWLEGEYWLVRATDEPRESVEPRLPIPRLVLELFLRSRDRSLVLKYLGGADVPLARAPNFDAEFATFGLTADAESVVRLIDGTSSAEEIASEAPAEAFAVEKLLAALVTLGLVHPEFAGETERPEGGGGAAAEPASVGEEEVVETEGPPEEAQGEAEKGAEEQAEEFADEESAEPEEREELADFPTEAGEEVTEEEEEAVDEGPRELGGEPDWTSVEEPQGDAPLGRDALLEPELEAAAIRETAGEPSAEFERFEAATGEPPEGPERPLDETTGVGLLERPRQRGVPTLVWVLLALAVTVGAVLVWRGRQVSSEAAPHGAAVTAASGEPTALAAPTPAVSAAAVAAEAPPTAVPSAVPTVPPAGGRPAPRPTPAKASPAAAPSAPATGKEGSRQYWLDRASHDAQRLASDRKTRYAVQLELVCEVPSLVDAFQHDRPSGTMWVLSTPHEGKTCFRVLWGRYPSIEAARRGLTGAPRFFSTQKNRPAVTGVR